MAAEDLRALGDPELPGDACGRFLDLDLWRGAEEEPFPSRHFAGCGLVDFAIQGRYLRAAGQGRDIWLHRLDHKGSLARPGFDQPQGGEQLDRVSYCITRRAVV